jgi:anthranilate phosphoribosyltransferase
MTFAELGGWPGVIDRLISGSSLEAGEAQSVMTEVLEGRAGPAQIAGLLVALRAKGESAEEVAGMVRAMLAHAEPLEVPGDLLDVVGTGGDRLASINVSTIAAFIAAGAGARVCKHGNRAASSSVGTADVLEALGVAVDVGPSVVARCIDEVGMGFCFARRFHPAMRFAGPVRSELGVPTVFNILGPLANPARARYQLVGVSTPGVAETMARVLGVNGSRRAMIVFADDGLDELSVTAPSTVVDLIGDGAGSFELSRRRIEPADVGLPTSPMAELRGGDAAFNARAVRAVLDGRPGAHRDIGVLNAAASLVVVGLATDLRHGVALAEDALDAGRAAAVLEGLVRVSQVAAAEAAAAEGAPTS